MFKTIFTNILKELIIPELDKIKADVSETKTLLGLTNKRIDDLSLHVAELSRRIDVNNQRIDETNKRIDETNQRIDETNLRIDETNNRLNSLYEVIVRREEHTTLEKKVFELEREFHEMKVKSGG